jgi:hypothetical protein
MSTRKRRQASVVEPPAGGRAVCSPRGKLMPAFAKGDPLTRLAGAEGRTRRWANASAEERSAQGLALREGLLVGYFQRAVTAAADRGETLTDAQALAAAEALWRADLAEPSGRLVEAPGEGGAPLGQA